MDGVLCVTPAELAESTGPVTFHPEPRSFALEELGTLQGFERVVTLDLTRWGVDDAEAKVLAKKVDLSAIERLQFAWNGLTVAGVRALLKKGVLPALRHLDLSFNGIGNAGTKAIKAVAPGTTVEVSLEGKSVTVEGFDDATAIAAAVDDAGFEFGGATAQWIKSNIWHPYDPESRLLGRREFAGDATASSRVSDAPRRRDSGPTGRPPKPTGCVAQCS